ncbi:histidine phosphatase family protein [Demequina pelophila]|uniref:histidine phosphatase family protein n=1 Tax=Demequina pelophila TaxID=1638984 RepID=UPI0007826E7F|nr:histidine phosphatase family protein [Demequina pelophila]
MPRVLLLRHGHVHNPEGVLYGRLPEFRLSEEGRAMADAAATFLRSSGEDVGRVVASPLLRAQQTAQPIADEFGHELATDDRLIEAGNMYEGQPLPKPRDFLNPQRWWDLRNPWAPSWGEPYKDIARRMGGAIYAAAKANPDSTSVLVSHQLPIWVARCAAQGRSFLHDPRQRQCALASLTAFDITDGRIRFEGYGETAVEAPR